MKKLAKVIITLTASTGIVSVLYAQELKEITPMFELSSQGNPIKADDIDVPDDKSSDSEPLAPAPRLTRISIYAVGSSNCDWEYIGSDNFFTTNCNHGGQQLRVAVLEIGYGSNPIATMKGWKLPNSARYSHVTVCVTNGMYTWPCRRGQVTVGWLSEYNLDGHQDGLFQYQNSSSSGGQDIVARINIR